MKSKTQLKKRKKKPRYSEEMIKNFMNKVSNKGIRNYNDVKFNP